jgi:polysaccharide chain length determinant protein (PEP-CTERM system associated)
MRTITQQIMSETRLEQVIRDLHLLDGLPDRKAMERYITSMRSNITIEVKGSDAFIVSYKEQDPHTAMVVANKLASLFIEENVKVREQRAIDTTEFLSQELRRVSQLLETQERAISEFKRRYMGELPQQQETNQRTLDRLQQQLQANLEAMEGARRRKSLLLQQLAVLPAGSSLAPEPQPHMLEQQLAQRREALLALQQLFTDDYPDVIRLKREVADLQARVIIPQPRSREAEREPPASSVPGSLHWQIQEEVSRIDLEVQRLQSQQDNLQRDRAAYEKKVANATQREQELHVLTRDYESTRQNYASLLDRRMHAQIAENLEKRQKAEQFKVLDAAGLPTKPWAPNRLKLLAMGLVLGIAVGGGAVFAVEYLDHSFRDPEDLKHYTGLPLLATIPFVLTAAEVRRQRLQRCLRYATGVGLPVATLAALHLFWMKIDLLVARILQLLKP